MRSALVLILPVIFASCAQPSFNSMQRIPISTQLNDVELAPFAVKGDRVINGQAFLRQRGGGVVTCAGQKVYLFPKTPYFDELVSIMRTRAVPDTGGKSLASYGRQTTCDAQGKFTFRDLPPATWYVTTEVSWSVGYEHQGGGVIKTISTQEAGTTDVFLTDPDRVGF